MSEPLYPAYLPTRPEGFTATINVPEFNGDEPGLRADRVKPALTKAGAMLDDITPRIGTEVTGIQLSALGKEGLDEVALLAAERGVLVFVCAVLSACYRVTSCRPDICESTNKTIILESETKILPTSGSKGSGT